MPADARQTPVTDYQSQKTSDATPPNASPLIILSYSKEDEGWKEQLQSRLSSFPKLRLVLQPVEDTPENDREAREFLAQANVFVLLLSPSYLTTSWIIRKDYAQLLSKLEPERRLKVLPVLLRDCPWQQNAFLRSRHVFGSDGKPIAERTGSENSAALKDLVSRIEHLATLSQEELKLMTTASAASKSGSRATTKELDSFKISEEVAKTLERARVLATFRDKPLVTTTCLLFALAEIGRPPFEARRTPQFLWQELSKKAKRYQEAIKEKFPRATSLSDAYVPGEEEMTGNVGGVFKLASGISLRTYEPKPQTSDDADEAARLADPGRVGARHLLAALLMLKRPNATGAQGTLSTITDVEVLRRRFLEFIIDSLPDDDHYQWEQILEVKPKRTKRRPQRGPQMPGNVEGHIEGIPVSVLTQALDEATESESLKASVPTEHASEADLPKQEVTTLTSELDAAEIDLKPLLAGFATDYWSGKDLLNIEDDVNALASLVSAWSVEPPLSIGLFGDWGSGKSHFMRQMRQRVETLSRRARKSPKKQNEIGYYKNIVQIEFNAWHYIEGNLWASLVDHIFANLRVSENETRSIVEARRDELMTKLGVKEEMEKKLKSKIEEKQNQLKVKQREATDVAKNAEAKKDDLSTQLAGFRSEAEKQLNELKVPLEVSETDKELLKRVGIDPDDWKTAADFRKNYDEIKGTWNRVAAQWKLFTTDRKVQRRVLLAGAITVIPLVGLILPTVSQTKKLPAAVLTLLGLLGTFLTAAVPIWKSFRNAFNALEEHDAAVERERQKRIGDLQAEVTALTKTVLDAQTEATSIRNEIENLGEQINSTTPSQLLAEFIEDRAAASDYRRHLGLLALIRKDFEKLRNLFNEQRQEERDGKETLDRHRINRIILYIDDLDRCPPQRVVDVLQAIHLLLAFPIFVVVVGVDARWVTRSLQESYEWLHAEDDETTRKEQGVPDDQRDTEGATPHDYLEKIFQIPFWLRPMDEDQAKTFIEGLTEQVRYRSPAEPEVKTNGDKESEINLELTTVVPDSVTELKVTNGNGHPPVGETVVDAAHDLNAEIGVAEATPTDDLPQNTMVTVTDDAANVEKHGSAAGTDSSSVPLKTIAPVPPGDAEHEVPATESEPDDVKDQHEESIDLAPQSLTLGDKEIEYMTSLAKLIGRSPRAIKRFLNCYRLIKVSLPPAKLKEFVQDGASYEYRAVMILLGIVTGAPKVSLHVIEEIENWRWEKQEPATMQHFLDQLEHNVELQHTSDWKRLSTFLKTFTAPQESTAMFAALRAVTPRVSRFSFRIARAEAAGSKRTTATRSKNAQTSAVRSK